MILTSFNVHNSMPNFKWDTLENLAEFSCVFVSWWCRLGHVSPVGIASEVWPFSCWVFSRFAAGGHLDVTISFLEKNWKNSLWRQAGGTNEYLSNCRLNHQSFPVASCKSGPPDTHQIMADFQKYCAIIPAPSQQIPSLELLSAAHMRLAIQLWTWLHCRDLRWWWPLGAPSLAGQWSAKILPLFRGFLARPCGTSSAATTISRFSDGHWAPKKKRVQRSREKLARCCQRKTRKGVKIWTENSRLKESCTD